MDYVVFAVTEKGMHLAGKIQEALKGSVLCLPDRLREKRDLPCRYFTSLKDEVASAFQSYNGLIFIMASGIVVRSIAPLLKGKDKDPAVLVLDEKGEYVISLLSGHLGGANRLAERVARLIGGRPVITTGTDVNNLPCIEEIASRINCAIEDIGRIRLVNSAILNGRRVVFIDEAPVRLNNIRDFLKGFSGDYRFLPSLSQNKRQEEEVVVLITERIVPHTSSNCFLLRPKEIVVGIGCKRGVSCKEVEEACFETLKRYGVSPLSVKNLATVDIKMDEKGLNDFAAKYGLKIDFYSRDELESMPLPSGVSERVLDKIGVGGICEPASLKSAGVNDIWVEKQKLGRVTIAMAKASSI